MPDRFAKNADNLRWVAVSSIVVAAVVLAVKYVAYRLTNSVALYSDALESIVNVITAIVALFALHVAVQPADHQHQFGHHKAEYFSAVVEGVLIVVAALLILHEAYYAFIDARMPHQPLQGIVISSVGTVMNAGWSSFLFSCGRRQRSPALLAGGWHLAADVATSVGVLLGLGLVAVTGWQVLDPVLASLVALNILWAGWRLTRSSVSGLMDEAVTAEVGKRIRKIISANSEGAIETHDLKTCTAGSATFIEFHLVVPGGMTVATSHEICNRIEKRLKEAVEGAEVLIHVEPEAEAQQLVQPNRPATLA